MSAEEINSIIRVFVGEGVNKIRLTGGEPLLRKDAKEIIRLISKYPVEISLTTNGVFVHEYIDVFKEAGIKSVNVSLDSLDEKTNLFISGRNEFHRVKNNIELLLKNEIRVKVNMVVIKNVNHHEIPDFVEWTKNEPIQVRFIEFMPFSGNLWSKEKVFSRHEMLELISSSYNFLKLSDEKHQTSAKYFIPEFRGSFAIISTMSEPFCSECNRMRLTTDGKMKNCLFSKNEADILGAFRRGEDIVPIIRLCLASKEEFLGGQFTHIYESTDASQINNRSMINIGG